MTTTQLEKIGIISLYTKGHPHLFFVPQIGEVNLYPPYRMEDIFEKIYEEGVEHGVERGKNQKISEIKKVLNIDSNE